MSYSLQPHGLQHISFPVLHYLLKFAQTHVHWVSDAIQPFHPLSPHLLLPSIFPSNRVISNESAHLIRWPKYWSFSFSISPSNEDSGLISFRIDWVQGTLKSLLQYNSKHQFFSAQHSLWSNSHILHDYWKSQYVCIKCAYSFICWWLIWGILFVYYYTQNCYEHLCTSLHTCSVASVVSRFMRPTPVFLGFPYGPASKESACNVGDLGWIPESGRSPGEGNGNPLQYSCLENPTDSMGLHEVRHDWSDWAHTKTVHKSLQQFCL